MYNFRSFPLPLRLPGIMHLFIVFTISRLYYCKVTGKCGSIWVRLIPAPRGTGIVSAPVPKKLLQMAGIEDCYTSARGSTGTLGNVGKLTMFQKIM